MRSTGSIFPFPLALILLALWAPPESQAYQGDELPQGVVLDWLKQYILEGLGLEEPPALLLQRPPGVGVEAAAHRGKSRVGRAAWVERRRAHQETSQVILFPSADSTCMHTSESSEAAASHFTYYFQLSMDNQESIVTSAHFWFYAGEDLGSGNASAPLFILTAQQELLRASEGPEERGPDGWTTYRLAHPLHGALADGPFMLQVRCPDCDCRCPEDKTPFLHLHVRPRGPERPRRAPRIRWSPEAIERLRRPSEARTEYGDDCRRERIEISFQELGWENWIVHPKAFTFYYCHGNCSSPERTTTLLGISQCCAPVPETMKSLRFTTTSDNGFSFKYETLPNIIPEECNCI